jgi:hypothetical protein
MSNGHEQAGGATTQAQPSEEEMRAAYEAELNRITSSEMILQTAVSLLNIGGRRLGLGAPPTTGSSAAGSERDLEQVRDAIDGASALLPILERRMPRELGPLRDAIAQLQVAYAREAQSAASPTPPATQVPGEQATPTDQGMPEGQAVPGEQGTSEGQAVPGEQGAHAERAKPAEEQAGPKEGDQQGPGPAQASGRLWVPGR